MRMRMVITVTDTGMSEIKYMWGKIDYKIDAVAMSKIDFSKKKRMRSINDDFSQPRHLYNLAVFTVQPNSQHTLILIKSC